MTLCNTTAAFFQRQTMTKAILRTHVPLRHRSACMHPDLSKRQNSHGSGQVLKQQPLTTPTPHLVPSGQTEDRIYPDSWACSIYRIEILETLDTLHLPETLFVLAVRRKSNYSCHQPSGFPTDGMERIRDVTTAGLASASFSTPRCICESRLVPLNCFSCTLGRSRTGAMEKQPQRQPLTQSCSIEQSESRPPQHVEMSIAA